MKKILALLILPCLLFIQQSFADDSQQAACEANGINFTEAQTLVSDLKTAIKADDKAKIADMIAFPLKVNASNAGKVVSKTIKDKTAFIAQYSHIFTTKTKDAIISDSEIFCRDQGGSIGGGSVWFNTIDKSLKIYSINL